MLKELHSGLGNTWAFFLRDVIYSLTRIMDDGERERKVTKRQKLHIVEEMNLFSPCCNLLYYVCETALQCCSQVGIFSSSSAVKSLGTLVT